MSLERFQLKYVGWTLYISNKYLLFSNDLIGLKNHLLFIYFSNLPQGRKIRMLMMLNLVSLLLYPCIE